jgi:hypothetical protein
MGILSSFQRTETQRGDNRYSWFSSAGLANLIGGSGFSTPGRATGVSHPLASGRRKPADAPPLDVA